MYTIRFKFNGHQVSFKEGKIRTKDKTTYVLLSPLVGGGTGGPEDGDPFLNLLFSIFGRESITDVEFDNVDPYLIH